MQGSFGNQTQDVSFSRGKVSHRWCEKGPDMVSGPRIGWAHESNSHRLCQNIFKANLIPHNLSKQCSCFAKQFKMYILVSIIPLPGVTPNKYKITVCKVHKGRFQHNPSSYQSVIHDLQILKRMKLKESVLRSEKHSQSHLSNYSLCCHLCG